jgi:hypothetical protein
LLRYAVGIRGAGVGARKDDDASGIRDSGVANLEPAQHASGRSSRPLPTSEVMRQHRSMLNELVSSGALSGSDFRKLEDLSHLRNVTVHGFSVPHIDPGVVPFLTSSLTAHGRVNLGVARTQSSRAQLRLSYTKQRSPSGHAPLRLQRQARSRDPRFRAALVMHVLSFCPVLHRLAMQQGRFQAWWMGFRSTIPVQVWQRLL